MKIIIRKSDSVVIWGTDDNETIVELIDNNFVVNGQIVATDVDDSKYTLIEDINVVLIDPFFVGYVTYNNEFQYTPEYIAWNNKTHNCLLQLTLEYDEKSEDIFYTDEERIAFAEYVQTLSYITLNEYIQPEFSYPTPPDEEFPFTPICSI